MMQHGCKTCIMLTNFGFSIHKVERYSYYFIIVELLFEFLSFDEFKFAKLVKGLDADLGMMRPQGACAAFGGGATFLGGCARFVRAYMLWQMWADWCVLAHGMNNIIL